jgi:hypothetical protein
MKSSIRNFVITLGLSAAFSPVALMAQGEIHATIPFDFSVGSKTFAAGDYSVQEVKDNIFAIRHGHSAILALVRPGEEVNTRPGVAVLTFKRYGESYFLCSVANGAQSWELLTSSAEKREIAKRASPKVVAVAAALPTK